MKISFLLHLYQPPFQNESTFRQVASECYLPLLKFIQAKKFFKVTLNTPLSLLELMDKFGYQKWILDLKSLIESGQVELVGCGAYHPLLTKISEEIVEKQIVLNEYGLGYYFGRHQGFEGEPAIMVKDVKGFFPPELAINDSVARTVADLGYEWIVVNPTALSSVAGYLENADIYSISESDVKLVVRNSILSNALAFRRDENITNLPLQSSLGVVALDGETFGHHNKLGIELLDSLLHYCVKKKIDIMTVSEYIQNSKSISIPNIIESTWAQQYSSDPDDVHNADNIYPLWNNNDNRVQVMQWKLFSFTQELAKTLNFELNFTTELFNSSKNIINTKGVPEKVRDTIINNDNARYLSFMKTCNSDQFWWSSGKIIADKILLYSNSVLNLSLSLYRDLSMYIDDLEAREILENAITSIREGIEDKG